jgi:DNA modification methylase
LEVFIRNSSDKGGVVLDGFAGTGSLPISAVRNERKFIAFEIEPSYIEIANMRLDSLEVPE